MSNFKENKFYGLAVFFAVFLPITGLFEYAVVNWNYGNWITGMMWSVGVSAIIALKIRGVPLSSLGWKWGKTKYQLLALGIPVGYGALSFLLMIALGLGEFRQDAFDGFVHGNMGIPEGPVFLSFLFFLVAYGLMSLPGSMATAAGEEIGWRGFLSPELNKHFNFFVTSIIVGLLWGFWHFPILFGGGYNAATGMGVSDALTFLSATVLASIIMQYLRMRSGSLWTAVIFHASHNLFLNQVFVPLIDAPNKSMLIGELGYITLGIVLVVAIMFSVLAVKRGMVSPTGTS